MNQRSWQEFVDALRSGAADAYDRLWKQHGEQLRRVAASRLDGDLRRRVDADDVLQSACRTFYRRVSTGEFHIPDSDHLWRLLCITVTKAQLHARFHLQQKRSVAREQQANQESPSPLADAASAPEQQQQLEDELHRIMQQLDDEQLQLLDLRMQQLDNQSIAVRMGCSERTVRRLLAALQVRFEQQLGLAA